MRKDIVQLSLQRNRYPQMSDADFLYMLQQEEGRGIALKKLPSLAKIDGWQYPKRLSMEQCSSEETARYKASLVGGKRLVDLTGGFGVDCHFMSERFEGTAYVERDGELCKVAEHNFRLAGDKIDVHQSDAESFVEKMEWADWVFIDPARRSESGGKVFRLEDCEPNVIGLLPRLRECCGGVMLKLSPMLDIGVLLEQVSGISEVHIVAVRNEVKEVLAIVDFKDRESRIRAVNMCTEQPVMEYFREEERDAEQELAERVEEYIYEPNVAVLKGGAFRLVGARYGLKNLAVNTHLYTSCQLVADFCGRVYRLVGQADKHTLRGMRLNIVSRNYPLSADQLRAKYRIAEGDKDYLIACRVGKNTCLLLCERLI